MTEKTNTLAWVLGIVLALGIIGHFAFPSTVSDPQDKATIALLNAQNANQSVQYAQALAQINSLKSVVSNVSTVPSVSSSSLLDKATGEWLKKFDQHDDWATCDGVLYDQSDMTWKVLEHNSPVGRDPDIQDVYFTVRESFKDSSDNHACKQDVEFHVRFETGERPIVELA